MAKGREGLLLPELAIAKGHGLAAISEGHRVAAAQVRLVACGLNAFPCRAGSITGFEVNGRGSSHGGEGQKTDSEDLGKHLGKPCEGVERRTNECL